MPYDPRVVQPMREEMVRMGAQELKTVAEVDSALGDQRGTTLVFVNSVCGCAAGSARPGLSLAMQHGNRPQRVVTVLNPADASPCWSAIVPKTSRRRTKRNTSPAAIITAGVRLSATSAP